MNDRQSVFKKARVLTTATMIISLGLIACTLPRPGANAKGSSVDQGIYEDCYCESGAYPSDLTKNYQGHYLYMVIDSYIVNQQLFLAQERLKSFREAEKIKALAEQSIQYKANEKFRESELTNELAIALKEAENWSSDTIMAVIMELSTEYQSNRVKKDALEQFSVQLIGVRLGQ